MMQMEEKEETNSVSLRDIPSPVVEIVDENGDNEDNSTIEEAFVEVHDTMLLQEDNATDNHADTITDGIPTELLKAAVKAILDELL
jgi:hypothetical protein